MDNTESKEMWALVAFVCFILAGMAMGQTPTRCNGFVDERGNCRVGQSKPNADVLKEFKYLDPPVARNISVTVSSQTGTVVKLSDAEYERLQKLRQAVKDAETEIAKAHNVKTDACTACALYPPQQNDHYEFRGQFLLINLPDKDDPPFTRGIYQAFPKGKEPSDEGYHYQYSVPLRCAEKDIKIGDCPSHEGRYIDPAAEGLELPPIRVQAPPLPHPCFEKKDFPSTEVK